MPAGTGTPVIPQAQLDLGPAAWWRPSPETPPGNLLRVKAGYAFAGAQALVDQPADQSTAGFASVALGTKRYDMVYIDASGAAVIAQGVQVPLANPLFDGAPGRPNGPPLPAGNPVAYVLIDEIGAVTVDVGDVFQINGFVALQRDLDGFVVDKGTFSAATLPAPTGSSDVVTLIFTAETRITAPLGVVAPNSGGSATQAGVVTTAPLNYVWLVDQNGDEIIHTATGAKVYGRLTEAGGVWTLAYHYIDAAGAEQSVTAIETDCTVTPSALTKLVGVPKVFSRHDPARPLFDSTISRLSDQVVGDIPTGTASVQGKLRIEAGGSLTAADLALGTSDARTGAVRGRANAGAVSGYQKTIRITGSGMTVGLVEAAGELQFTLTAGASTGGIDQAATTSSVLAPTSLTINPAFVPRIGFATGTFTNPGVETQAAFGVFAGSGVGPSNLKQMGLSCGVGPLAGAHVAIGFLLPYSGNGWSCTSFLSSNVTISQGSSGILYAAMQMMVLGGA